MQAARIRTGSNSVPISQRERREMIGWVRGGIMVVAPKLSAVRSRLLSSSLTSLLSGSSSLHFLSSAIGPRRNPPVPSCIPGFSLPAVLSRPSWILHAKRTLEVPPASKGEALESLDDGSWDVNPSLSKKKRPGWKRIPPFGFPESPRWIERRPRAKDSAGIGRNRYGESFGGEGGQSSREYSSSTSSLRADSPQSSDEGRGGMETAVISGQETRGQSTSARGGGILTPSHHSGSGYGSRGQSEREGGGARSQTTGIVREEDTGGKQRGKNKQAGRPPFKPKANYYERVGKFEREGNGGIPFKPRANYYETLGHSQREGGNGSSRTGNEPRFKTQNNRGDAGGRAFKPKANYNDTLRRSQGEGRSPAASSHGHLIGERGNLGKNSRGRSSSSVEGGQQQQQQQQRDEEDSSDRAGGAGPHYGYRFRSTGTELGHFRRISPTTNAAHGEGEGEEDGRTGDARGSGAFKRPRKQYAADGEGGKGMDPQAPDGEYGKYPPRRLEGEKRWQYAVRKKHMGLAGHTRGSTKKSAMQFVDDEELGNEPQGDDWRRRKVAWLCKEIPPLRPRPIVTILNDQRKWINAIDTKYIVEHLLQINQTLRAHRVLKWEMQQPWFQFDYDLSSKVAVQLGQNNKLSRTRDIYDLIIQNGKVPDLPTYAVLINCYIADGANESLKQAWSLYNQMTQLGTHEPPPTLSYNLFQGLVQKGSTFLEQGDAVFNNIKMAGLVCSTEMYTLLIHAHGTKGNQDKVDHYIKEMKETGLPIGQDVYAAILRACTKDGNVAAGEQAFADLKLSGHKPIPSVYASLIKIYGNAGLPEKAFQTFEEMRQTGMLPNITIYEPIIETAALSDNIEQAEKLLKEAQERQIPSLHGCYNSVLEVYSKHGLLGKLETTFQEMGTRGYPPNQASFNVRLGAYVRHGDLKKAEALYEEMKGGAKCRPNRRTYELMIKCYGEAGNSPKVQEVCKELAGKKMEIPEGGKKYIEAALSAKQLEAHRKLKLQLKREQREILAGVLLAGAGVESHDKDRTYELHFGLDPDGEVGPPLLNHLFREFCDWSTEAPRRQALPDPKDSTKSKTLLAFQTVSHGSFRFFAHQYRPQHSPVIPRLVHRWLTPRALAYWYMYGGTKCPRTGHILFNASAYSSKDIMLVVNALKSRTIDCERIGTRNGPAIRFKGRSATWLWALMEPYVLPEVKSLLKPDGEGLEDINLQQ